MPTTDVSTCQYDINMEKRSVTRKSHFASTVLVGAFLICLFGIWIFHFLSRDEANLPKDHRLPEETFEQPAKLKEPQFLSGKNKVTFLDTLKQETLDDFIPLSNDHQKPILATIEAFNNAHLTPRLQSIVSMDFFHYVKLNLNRECKLWSNDDRCSLRLVYAISNDFLFLIISILI